MVNRSLAQHFFGESPGPKWWQIRPPPLAMAREERTRPRVRQEQQQRFDLSLSSTFQLLVTEM